MHSESGQSTVPVGNKVRALSGGHGRPSKTRKACHTLFFWNLSPASGLTSFCHNILNLFTEAGASRFNIVNDRREAQKALFQVKWNGSAVNT